MEAERTGGTSTARPVVRVVRNGSLVESIEIVCPCGETIVVDCAYDAATGDRIMNPRPLLLASIVLGLSACGSTASTPEVPRETVKDSFMKDGPSLALDDSARASDPSTLQLLAERSEELDRMKKRLADAEADATARAEETTKLREELAVAKKDRERLESLLGGAAEKERAGPRTQPRGRSRAPADGAGTLEGSPRRTGEGPLRCAVPSSPRSSSVASRAAPAKASRRRRFRSPKLTFNRRRTAASSDAWSSAVRRRFRGFPPKPKDSVRPSYAPSLSDRRAKSYPSARSSCAT
jgi:hypothetical protein